MCKVSEELSLEESMCPSLTPEAGVLKGNPDSNHMGGKANRGGLGVKWLCGGIC